MSEYTNVEIPFLEYLNRGQIPSKNCIFAK